MITGRVLKMMPGSIRRRIEDNKELRAIIGNINWLTFENLLRSIIGMFIFGWIARYLGPEQFGLMSYSVAFVALFAAFSTLGLDDIIVRGIISNPQKRESYLGTTLVLKFFGSLAMIIFSLIGIFIIEKDSSMLRLFVLILSFGYVFKSLDIIDLWFKSQVQSQYSVYARSISFVIVSILKIVLILTKAPLIAFVIMYSLDFLLSAVFLIFFYKKTSSISMSKWKIQKDMAKELIESSWPLFLGGLTLTIESEIDQVLLKNMIGAEELGLYSASLKVILSFSFICAVLRSSFLPSIISAKKVSEELYQRKLEQFYQMMMITFLLVAVPLIIFKNPVIQLLYGKEYLNAAAILPLMSIRLFFTHYSTARAIYLLNENLLKYSFFTTLMGTITNIVLNMYLIPIYSSTGAIIAFIVSFVVTVFLIDLIYPKTRNNAWIMIRSTFNFYKLFIK